MHSRPQQVHPNYIKASNLIFATIALGVISYLLFGDAGEDRTDIAAKALSLLLAVGLAMLVRLGYKWVKYLLLGLIVSGLMMIGWLAPLVIHRPAAGLVIIGIQIIMQAWALVLLFRVRKVPHGVTLGEQLWQLRQ